MPGVHVHMGKQGVRPPCTEYVLMEKASAQPPFCDPVVPLLARLSASLEQFRRLRSDIEPLDTALACLESHFDAWP